MVRSRGIVVGAPVRVILHRLPSCSREDELWRGFHVHANTAISRRELRQVVPLCGATGRKARDARQILWGAPPEAAFVEAEALWIPMLCIGAAPAAEA